MKSLFFVVLICLASNAAAQQPRLVVPVGHTDIINCVAFSPDGKYLLTGSSDHKAKLWDWNGHEVQMFSGHTSSVLCATFSPDGKQVLTGSRDRTARLWDMQGNQISVFPRKEYSEDVLSVAISPDAKFVLTGNFDNRARLWNIQGDKIRDLQIHSDDVKTVIFSPACPDDPNGGRYALTASWDTVKITDLKGRKIYRLSQNPGGLAAFSADCKHVVTAHFRGTISIWDWRNERRIREFSSDSSYIESFALSPDGRHILTSVHDIKARLINLNDNNIQEFSEYYSSGRCAAFSPDGQFILTGGKRNARLWNINNKTSRELSGRSQSPENLIVSPNGDFLLISGWESAARIWDFKTGSLLKLDKRFSIKKPLAFSADGRKILTGGAATVYNWQGDKIQKFPNDSIFISAGAFSPDGQFIALAGDKTLMLWNLQNKEVKYFPCHCTYRVTDLAFSPDGQNLLVGGFDTVVLMDLQGKRQDQYFTGSTSIRATFSPVGEAIITAGWEIGTKLVDWQNNLIQSFPKDTLSSPSALAFAPNGQYFLRTNFSGGAKMFNRTGGLAHEFKGHSGAISFAAFSPDSRYAITASKDHTTKIWDCKTGSELATLIVLDSTDWVVTTPSGLFDASPGAMNLMYFVVGLEVIELEQLKERYYEPGLLSKIMGFSDEPLREVEGFDSVALYPVVQLRLDTIKNKLHIHLGPRNGGVGKVSVFINGKEVKEEANPPKGYDKIRDTVLVIDLGLYARYFLTDTFNTISIRAYNAAGWLKSAPQDVEFWSVPLQAKGDNKGSSAGPVRAYRRPALHVIAVGTADYAGEQLDLKYSGKDARDMAGALRQIGTQLFSRDSVFIHLLTTDSSDATLQPTKANIRSVFETIKKRAKAEDIVVVYFSGHGIAYGDADRALFYYLTREIGSFDLSDSGVRNKRAISSDTLTRWINDIPAQKQVLILDACNSGKVVENLAASQKSLDASQWRALERMKDRTGMFVLTGSAADKVSYEAGQFGQGLLTYSILEGMKGEVPDVFGKVDVMKLFQYACDRVPNLAKSINGIQTPMLVGPLGGSFDIGIADSSVHIPIAQAKSVFIRSIFLDEEHFDDGLGLTNALKDYLVDQTALGDANFIYVDVSGYENAYSIKGLYRISGNDLEVRGRLFKGKTPVGEAFNVKGKKDDMPGLVEAIVDEVMGRME